MFIDRVFRTTKAILNTDGIGNFKPADFNDILYQVINEKQEELIYDLNRNLNRQNRGLVNNGIENSADRITEKLNFYLTEQGVAMSGSTYPLPSDLRYLDSVLTNTGAEIEVLKNSREFKIVENLVDSAPTAANPIGVVIGGNLKVAPTTYVDDVAFTYIRNPLAPNWTYDTVGGVEIFNPSKVGFQDVDIHPSEESDVIIRVLMKFGVNLKEQQVAEIANREISQDFQKENSL